jgi:hypothetical protein
MKLNNTFLHGKMNLDVDERLLAKGQYPYAQNIRVANTDASDIGAIENVRGNKALTSLGLSNAKTIGALSDPSNNLIYWFVNSTEKDLVLEYNTETDTLAPVLEATNPGLLGFDKNYLITGLVKISNEDPDKDLLVWTDNLNPPRMINIERAKSYDVDGFTESNISVIKPPPTDKPTITLVATGDVENHIEEKFFRFSYRYKYIDGQYSVMAPFSEVAFLPRTFNYDYSTATNKSMLNFYNGVDIDFNTGPPDVVEVEILSKESGSNNVNIIETFVKANELPIWDDNDTKTYRFTNTKIKKVLPDTELLRLYDNVPQLAKALELIGNRLCFGNYTENYDIVDPVGDGINIDLNLTHTPSSSSLTGDSSCKSHRDYEAGVVYSDSATGRMTTVLTSRDNNTHIPIVDAIKKNELKVDIKHLAPSGFDQYRVFVKQNKGSYDSISPTLFYNDDAFVWVKLEGNDASKVSEGDYIIVKGDSKELKDSLIKTRVLEIAFKPTNFLENDDQITEILQRSGTYMKLKPDGYALDEADYIHIDWGAAAWDGDPNSIRNNSASNASHIEAASFYGPDISTDDLTVNTAASYTASVDYRYEVEIQTPGNPDLFRWRRVENYGDGPQENWTNNIPCSLTPTALGSDGVSITWGSVTGHSVNDRWVIPVRYFKDDDYPEDTGDGRRAYSITKGLDGDRIRAGSQIYLLHQETGDQEFKYEKYFTASQDYDNLEELLIGDGIVSDMISEGIGPERIWFRRGDCAVDNNSSIIPTG